MLDQQQVEALFRTALERAKPFLKDGKLAPKKRTGKPVEYPELWEGQDDAWKQKHALRIHVEQGVDAANLLLQQSPNQSKEELEYVRKNARQVTLTVYQDYENTIRRALSDGNWSITYRGGAAGEEAFEGYVNSGLTEFDSVLNFVRYMLPKAKTLDPMGLLVVHPGEVPTEETEDGQVVVAADAMISPQIMYVPVERVWGFKYDTWYLYQSYEESVVVEGNKNVRKGIVCYLVDDTRFWRIEQYGELKDYTFTFTEFFEHGVGYPPADHLKGVPVWDDGQVVHQSHYLTCKELLDLAFIDAQRLQVVKNAVAFPHKVMVGDDCDFVDRTTPTHAACMGGKVTYYAEEGMPIEKTCPQCGGSGVKSRMSPLGVLLIRPKDPNGAGGGDTTTAPQSLYFVEPSTANMEFLSAQVEKNIDAARQVMHLQSETAQQGGAQPETATNAGLRSRSTIAFIRPIADQMFGTIDFLLDAIGRMRYGADFGGESMGYTLTRPINLDLRTEADMIAEIKEAKASGLPQAVIDRMVWHYISLRYQSEPSAMDAFEVIAQADRLLSLDPAQVQSEATAGRAQPWEVVLHWSALSIYEHLLTTGAAFNGLDVQGKAEAMKAYARTLSPVAATRNALPRLAEAVNQ